MRCVYLLRQVLNLWKGLDAFKKQLDLSKDKPE